MLRAAQGLAASSVTSLPVGRRTVCARRARAFSVRAMAEPTYDFDLFTIGAGSGGVRASRMSSSYGAKVAICEMPYGTIPSETTGGAGGTCVLRGCVPKKLLVFGSTYGSDFSDSQGFGWTGATGASHDWPTLMAAKNKEIQRLNGVYQRILTNAGVQFIEGRGTIVDAHTIDVGGKKYTAKHILVATGGRATVPDIPGKELGITSDEALDLPERPRRVVIVGGGYIALEFACIFRGFGSEVDLVFRQELPLRGFDEDVRAFVLEQLKERGIRVHAGASPMKVENNHSGSLTLEISGGTKLEADQVMFATGRSPNVRNLGLESVGVQMDQNSAIKVDEFSRTTCPSVWAVGDVTNRINLTPVALMEGMALAATLFKDTPTRPQYDNVACAVFMQPPVSVVGLTEAEAVKAHGDVDIYQTTFKAMKHTISGRNEKTFMKLVVDPKTDKVLGVHVVGADSAEMMQGFAVALKCGATKAHFDSTIGIHPTAAEELVTMRSVSRQVRKDAAAAPVAKQ